MIQPTAGQNSSLKGKVVCVIGGAGLIGRNFIRGIAECGGTVVAADIDENACKAVVADLEGQLRSRVLAMHVDILDKGSIDELIQKMGAQFGSVDALVNCAYPRNANYGRRVEDVAFDDFCENVSMHLGGYFLTMQQFGLLFCRQGRGNFVNVASIYGTMVPRFDIYRDTKITMPIEYAAIKAALIQMTRYFGQYFKGYDIRANCLSPGGVLENQPESFIHSYNSFCNKKGLLDPEDIVGTLIFLLSDESRYITGQNIIVDDGFQL